jgi:hypothetical protein
MALDLLNRISSLSGPGPQKKTVTDLGYVPSEPTPTYPNITNPQNTNNGYAPTPLPGSSSQQPVLQPSQTSSGSNNTPTASTNSGYAPAPLPGYTTQQPILQSSQTAQQPTFTSIGNSLGSMNNGTSQNTSNPNTTPISTQPLQFKYPAAAPLSLFGNVSTTFGSPTQNSQNPNSTTPTQSPTIIDAQRGMPNFTRLNPMMQVRR